MEIAEFDAVRVSNPVDTVEQIASFNDWSFDRTGDHEITISVNGRASDYHVSFTWMDEIEALHLACAFDLKVPDLRRAETVKLICRINEQLWLGHFDLWIQEGVVMFRHALPLSGGADANERQCQVMLECAMDACERYYQAFQFVIWAGKSAEEALEAVLFETAGEA
ncbi:MAG: YbjN domain-containing protein [Flavobacteriaceae bacterium]